MGEAAGNPGNDISPSKKAKEIEVIEVEYENYLFWATDALRPNMVEIWKFNIHKCYLNCIYLKQRTAVYQCLVKIYTLINVVNVLLVWNIISLYDYE